MTDCFFRISRLRSALRSWFDREEFIEVRTNSLAFSPGFDAYSRPFRTCYEDRAGNRQDCFLVTSPEFEMKGLLSRGMERIWQIARSFRNGDRDRTHLPEFDMLEWYRKGSDYRKTMSDAEELVRTGILSAAPDGRVRREGRTCDCSRPFERIPLPDIFLDRTGLDLVRLQEPGAFLDAARSAGFGHIPPDSPWDDIFFMVFLEKIEPELLAMPGPVLLYDHPVQVFSLARSKPGRPEFVERFECYAAGLELCNGYTELDDWDEHIRRSGFLAETCRKKGLPAPASLEGLEPFIRHGLGLCSGVALGMERLAMAALSRDDIREVAAFDIFAEP